MEDVYETEVEILVAIARTKSHTRQVISARTFTGNLKTATLIGLVSEEPFRIELKERKAIARALIALGFTHFRFERLNENGEAIEHGPFKLRG